MIVKICTSVARDALRTWSLLGVLSPSAWRLSVYRENNSTAMIALQLIALQHSFTVYVLVMLVKILPQVSAEVATTFDTH